MRQEINGSWPADADSGRLGKGHWWPHAETELMEQLQQDWLQGVMQLLPTLALPIANPSFATIERAAIGQNSRSMVANGCCC